uniref:Molecular chaperone MKKS n=1 Tax=Pavo cristatus TaxID=9049 RepID=A0A8C9EMZ3_PAVCR
MSCLEAKKPSLFISEPLTTVSQPLSLLIAILKSCYGPAGRLKQLHNGVGGYVCLTSQSSAILGRLSVSHPVLKVLTASVQNHVSRFSDCGLFTAILCCSLIENFKNLNIASCTVIKISKHLLSLCTDYLKSEACGCRVSVDFSNLETLLCLVRSILTSKPACMLNKTEVDHLAVLIVKAFMFTVPCHPEAKPVLGKCVTVPVKGRRVLDSTVIPGLLIETPEIQFAKPFPVRRTTSDTVKVAVFCVSMSGDLFDPEEGTVTVHRRISLEMSELDQLLNVGKQLVNDEVGLVVCQKVIHPSLKQYLKDNHVVAVDRAGLSVMEPLSQVTGNELVLYWLAAMIYCTNDHRLFYENSKGVDCSQTQYQLIADAFCHSLESVACSLSHDDGEILTDMAYGHCWLVPSGFPSVTNWSDLLSKCGCRINSSTKDLNWRHLRPLFGSSPIENCPKEPSVKVADFMMLDCFAAKYNGLQVAVETANLILDLSCVIEDQN